MSQTEIETQIPEMVNQAVETHEKKSASESFAELRKAKEDLERQLWQVKKEREIEMQMRNQQMQSQNHSPQEEDYDFRQLEQEEFPDGKKLVKAFGQFNKKLSAYEQKLAEKEQKIQVLETAQEFPDFKEVVTADNIEKYIKSDEDYTVAVEHAYKSGANPLRKVYNLIKKSTAYQQDKALKEKIISQEQKRVDDKEAKPKTGSLGVRSEAITTAAQLSNSKMSKEQKAALWKETISAARK
jgi:hypothetical protein